VANIIRFLYFAIDPVWTKYIFEARVAIFFVTITWPMSIMVIFLIAIYWEELLSDKFKVSSFVSRYRNLFITLSSVLVFVNVLLSILLMIIPMYNFFLLAVYIITIFHILAVIAMFIYSVVNTVRMKKVTKKLNKNKKFANSNNKRSIEKTADYFLGANICMLIFLIGVFMQLIGLNYKLNFELFQSGLVFLGLVISDLCIVFCFTFNESKISTLSSSANTKKSGSIKV